MVKRECVECGEIFHPYDETDTLCNDCYPKKYDCWCKGCHTWFSSYNESDDLCRHCENKLEEEFKNAKANRFFR